ncbi:uncharacterized protein LOC108136801 isoform X1 [Drosophila elegans]|uniref:uncharacterized protein LOC108136801 isoform X1 n=1 Tax=Drosophila elegans TaxID=30023 RepID=UPI0007E70F7E|nr:uncharacterized protein LOC108136801 isoform X1 [Drosophila elegans]
MSQEPAVAAPITPEYCHFFKTLLVEELELENNYLRLHYGQAAIIGRLALQSAHFFLENVRVRSLPENCSLPEGAVSLLLLGLTREKAIEQRVSTGCYCIVRGEVVLCNVLHSNSSTLTARGVNEQFASLAHDPIAQKQFLSKLRLTHKPAIDLWFIQPIDKPEDLLTRRLKIRGLTVR